VKQAATMTEKNNDYSCLRALAPEMKGAQKHPDRCERASDASRATSRRRDPPATVAARGAPWFSARPMGERSLLVSSSAHARVARAEEWLARRGRADRVLLLGASVEAVSSLARPVAAAAGASFGWTRLGLGRLASILAAPALVERALVPAGGLALEALCARVVHKLASNKQGLGRFAPVADRPGLPRALARTIHELRMAEVTPARLGDADLARVFAAYEAELADAKLADRADVLRLAAARAGERGPYVGLPTLLLDVPVGSALEQELVARLTARASEGGADVLATCPRGDDRSLAMLERALGVAPEAISTGAEGALARLQDGLFREDTPLLGSRGGEVSIVSAPGESRECVEIARRAHAEAARGVPFDRIAVLLRSTTQYRAHLVEAFRRAGVPMHVAQGTVVPDPSGRAMLALLACAAEGLSARRFAEYVSLGEVPDADAEGAPPRAKPPGDRFVAPDEEALPGVVSRAREDEVRTSADDDAPAVPSDTAPVAVGTLRAPRRWERLLVDAAVIGGRDRWRRRLAGLAHERKLDLEALEDPDSPQRERIARELGDLEALRNFALPLLDALAELPQEATWRVWLDALTALATRALRRPNRVLAVLGELAPMAAIGSVRLREVRLALAKRLTELVVLPGERRYGKVYVGSAEGARGMAFDVVFVPGLSERLFPQKVSEDPILRDVDRKKLEARLTVNADRALAERLALHLAVGAAKTKVCLSYPRIDTEQSRPRTPSFYGLEVLRAAEGQLPGFDELAKRAERESPTRLGWPAPGSPLHAIDDAEHDLALLAQVFQRPVDETAGTARYLVSANAHLARALRFRYVRWEKKYFAADGLVSPAEIAKAALAKHQIEARSYSPTALQNFATCPYKFVLYALHKLSPREEPEALEELDALQKGSLVHDILFQLHVRLREAALLPVPSERAAYDRARAILDATVQEVADKHRENLNPAIPRVWEDGIASIRADLVEFLRRAAESPEWVPACFELSFGLGDRRDQDPASTPKDVPLDVGLRLRGSIDLVEKRADGAIRATDYKTGKARAKEGCKIGGGEVLQPVLYSLVLEKLFAGSRVDGGRLYYCTSTGDFTAVEIPLDPEARDGAALVAKTIGDALRDGFLPAAPVKGGCEYCDYKVVCGPYEEARTKRKPQPKALVELRKRQ
jgi:CRISPR/Cas system-associated exonuclease Cas4 (RecB family)